MNRKIKAIFIILLLAASLTGCFLPHPAPANYSQDEVVNTESAATVIALSTELAAKRPTPTPMATMQGTPPIGGENAATPPADGTPQPAQTATADNSVEATIDPNAPCNQAEFIRDVTIPDGSVLPPSSPFTKIWEIRNVGSCPWTSDYQLEFTGSGDRMEGTSPTAFITNGEVKPGQSVNVAVQLVAPGEVGEYKGRWWLRAPDETNFGVGEDAAGTIYVDLKVDETFSFAEQMCSAAWSTAAGNIPCPGSETAGQGFVSQVTDPILESGVKETGLGLLVVPQPSADGYIVGRYPAVIVPDQADFRAVIGCAPESTGCYVKFRVTYQVDNGAEQL